MKCPRCTYTIVSTDDSPFREFLNRKLHVCQACLFQWYTFEDVTKEGKMEITWTDAQGAKHEIRKMPTPYIENCLAIIDERIPTLISRVYRDNKSIAKYEEELKTKQGQKAEMMRVLHERRRVSNSNAGGRPKDCFNCKYSDYKWDGAACLKLLVCCSEVNYYCAAWMHKGE